MFHRLQFSVKLKHLSFFSDVDRSFARIVRAAHTDATLSHDQQFMTSSGHALTYSFHTILKHIAILFAILRALRIYTCYRPI